VTRFHPDWLSAYLDYSEPMEAPRHLRFWCWVSAIAGALRRKVWIDQAYFKWYANFYICLVAPPGIVSKSTTVSVAMSLLRQVPDIQFGPDVVTWPALLGAFAETTCTFQHADMEYIMSPLTLESSEFGNLLNTQDKEMVDLLVSLWDGKAGVFEKRTKHSGNDKIENPWINLIACTTPSWIAGNFPEYMIGGGFTSRTLFVYADSKSKYVAYPGMHVPPDMDKRAASLVNDLTHISQNLAGPFTLTHEAIRWGEAWYRRHYSTTPINLDADRFGGYIARKQTHIHKLAMILSASSSDDMTIRPEHLEVAAQMVTDLEPDMQFVFNKIGKSQVSQHVEKLVGYVHTNKEVPFTEAYRVVHSFFPSMRDFDDLLAGCVRAGYIILTRVNGVPTLTAGTPLPSATNHTQN